MYYHSHGPLWRALWGSYELDQSGDPTGYETSWAREFFYDSPRARYLAVDYDTVVQGEGSDDPKDWTWDASSVWTEYAGVLPYTDLETDRDVADPNHHPAQYEYERTEVLRYLGTAAQQTADTNETAFYHGDLIGSTNLTTDDDGDAIQTGAVAYTAFGEILDANGSPGGKPPTGFTRYQYAGGWSYESGLLNLYGVNPNLPPITLQHLGHRWYQPDMGRFVQRDPIGIGGGLNVYVYCLNDPLAEADPTGLYPSPIRPPRPGGGPRLGPEDKMAQAMWLDYFVKKYGEKAGKRMFLKWLAKQGLKVVPVVCILLWADDAFAAGQAVQDHVVEPAIKRAQAGFNDWLKKVRKGVGIKRGMGGWGLYD